MKATLLSILFFSIHLFAAGNSSLSSSITVARVANYVVTSREVEISSVMDHWFLLHKKNNEKITAKTDWLLDINSQAFQKQLNTIMAEYLVMSEAENFSVAKLPATEIEKSAKEISESLSSWNEWKNMQVSLSELEQNVGRHLRAREFIKFKTESMGIQASDEEAKKYYDENKARFNNLPFEGFKESIKEFLINRDIEGKMKDWFDVLRKKYRVKILQAENEK